MSDLFNVETQLAFYSSYHRNPINITVHMIFVPTILWTCLILGAPAKLPDSIIPHMYKEFTPYLAIELNLALLYATVYQLYCFALEPLGALLQLPQIVLMTLSATAIVHNFPNLYVYAVGLQVLSWIMQFASHAFAEGRAPALLDNLVGALVLGPFFVHLETLFLLGFKPELHKRINNLAAIKLAQVKKAEGEKRRSKAAAEGKKDL